MIGLRSIPINFKEVYTIRTSQFHINPFITVRQLINNLRPELAIQFGINENEIEIVESGQYHLGCLPEEAPALLPSDEKLYEIWGENLQYVSFYVRRKNHVYPQIEAARRRTLTRASDTSNLTPQNTFTGDCPICLENLLLTIRYGCSHGVCSGCYSRCQLASINVCSLCRAN
jgi:hypothetical protein